jgi:hypothetical protein
MNTKNSRKMFISTDRAAHGHNGNNWITADCTPDGSRGCAA